MLRELDENDIREFLGDDLYLKAVELAQQCVSLGDPDSYIGRVVVSGDMVSALCCSSDPSQRKRYAPTATIATERDRSRKFVSKALCDCPFAKKFQGGRCKHVGLLLLKHIKSVLLTTPESTGPPTGPDETKRKADAGVQESLKNAGELPRNAVCQRPAAVSRSL